MRHSYVIPYVANYSKWKRQNSFFLSSWSFFSFVRRNVLNEVKTNIFKHNTIYEAVFCCRTSGTENFQVLIRFSSVLVHFLSLAYMTVCWNLLNARFSDMKWKKKTAFFSSRVIIKCMEILQKIIVSFNICVGQCLCTFSLYSFTCSLYDYVLLSCRNHCFLLVHTVKLMRHTFMSFILFFFLY